MKAPYISVGSLAEMRPLFSRPKSMGLPVVKISPFRKVEWFHPYSQLGPGALHCSIFKIKTPNRSPWSPAASRCFHQDILATFQAYALLGGPKKHVNVTLFMFKLIGSMYGIFNTQIYIHLVDLYVPNAIHGWVGNCLTFILVKAKMVKPPITSRRSGNTPETVQTGTTNA